MSGEGLFHTYKTIDSLLKAIAGGSLKPQDRINKKLILEINPDCPTWTHSYSKVILLGAVIRSLIATGPNGWISTTFTSNGCSGQGVRYNSDPGVQPTDTWEWQIVKGFDGERYFLRRPCGECPLRAKCQE